MKEKWYPYRFKVESEFLDEFGSNWRRKVDKHWNMEGMMDYLFGKPYPFFVEKGEDLLDGVDNSWAVSWDMLTENEPIVPNYKPKKIERSL